MKKNYRILFIFFLVAVFFITQNILAYNLFSNPEIPAPVNEPANIGWDGNTLVFKYNDGTIFRAEIENADEDTEFRNIIDDQNGVINQVIKFTSRKNSLILRGIISASQEAFPCESDRKRTGPDIVRHSVGLSNSLLNRAVYDRMYDWVLSVDYPSNVEIIPGENSETSNTFKVTITGRDIIIRFRPYFYKNHRKLYFFKPWTYQVWQEPVVGWCSWFAYFKDVTEEKIKETTDIISEVLAPFGYEYIQMDDGYQQSPAGTPETWLNPNNKFPSGLKDLAGYVSGKGLKPGIWTYTSFHQKDFAEANKDLFVLDDQGNVAYGNWVGYIMDGSNPETYTRIIRPLYSGLKEMGWKYFKVDALRHLRYEGYNSYTQYFKERKDY